MEFDTSLKIILPLVGILVGFYIERWRLKKRFDSGYYRDLWKVIQNVNGVIQRKGTISNPTIMSGIREKYSCDEIKEYLQSCVRTRDKKLKKLLDDFVSNITKYEFVYTGKMKIDEFEESIRLSNDLSNRIEKRIRRLIVK